MTNHARFFTVKILKSVITLVFKDIPLIKRGLRRSFDLQRLAHGCVSALQIFSKLCILCNGRSPAEAHGPPGLQIRLHYIRTCTKKGRKARRREGDKCFFFVIFLPAAFFQPTLTACRLIEQISAASGANGPPHALAKAMPRHFSRSEYICRPTLKAPQNDHKGVYDTENKKQRRDPPSCGSSAFLHRHEKARTKRAGVRCRSDQTVTPRVAR